MREVKLTKWRDITHELTGQVQFRPENSRRALNIPIRETAPDSVIQRIMKYLKIRK